MFDEAVLRNKASENECKSCKEKLLEININSNSEYKRWAVKNHPDKVKNKDKDESEKIFKEISTCNDIIYGTNEEDCKVVNSFVKNVKRDEPRGREQPRAWNEPRGREQPRAWNEPRGREQPRGWNQPSRVWENTKREEPKGLNTKQMEEYGIRAEREIELDKWLKYTVLENLINIFKENFRNNRPELKGEISNDILQSIRPFLLAELKTMIRNAFLYNVDALNYMHGKSLFTKYNSMNDVYNFIKGYIYTIPKINFFLEILGKNFNKYWFPINTDKPVSIHQKRTRSRTPPRQRRDAPPVHKNEENPKPDRCGVM